MDYATLENYIKKYIELNRGGVANFIWHGGEPLLAGLEFFEKAVQLQNKYAGETLIVNCIQTNGTLLNNDWCSFFNEQDWLVGISLDGPEHIHNASRTYTSGRGSFAKVMEGIDMLVRHGVEWNAMAVVNSINVKCPEEFYAFFKKAGCRYLQFTPIVERRTSAGRLASCTQKGTLTEQSITPAEWGDFLCRVFDCWIKEDVGRIFVQIFDATLANWLGEMPGLCSMGKSCGHAAVVAHNGDIYCCDHFVFPEYKLGNINNDDLRKIMTGNVNTAFSRLKTMSMPAKCSDCRFLFACNGECPKNRFVDQSGTPHNYLCRAYKKFFAHAAPYMDFMAAEFKAKRSPANVMKLFRAGANMPLQTPD